MFDAVADPGKGANKFLHNFEPLRFNIDSYALRQGWATVLVSGPHVGRRSPSRAG